MLLTKELLANTYVFVGCKETNKQVQEKLFELGFRWQFNSSTFKHPSAKWLYLNSDYLLSFADKFDYGLGDDWSGRVEIPASLILSNNITYSVENKFDNKLMLMGKSKYRLLYIGEVDD